MPLVRKNHPPRCCAFFRLFFLSFDLFRALSPAHLPLYPPLPPRIRSENELSQALGGGSKRKRAVLKNGDASKMMAMHQSQQQHSQQQQQQQQQPSTPARSTSSTSTALLTTPPHSSASAASPSSAAALAPFRTAMLSWSAALTRLQPKCVVDDAARERGLRLLVRFQSAVRLGERDRAAAAAAAAAAASSSAASSSSSSQSSPSSSSSARSYRGDFCSSPLPTPSPLTSAHVASALWIAIKAEGVRCAVPSRGLLARATGVAPADLAAAELSMLVALKFDVFLGDVLFFREEDEMMAGKENAMV